MKALYLNYIHVMATRIQAFERIALNQRYDGALSMDEEYEIRTQLTDYHGKMYYAAQKLAGL